MNKTKGQMPTEKLMSLMAEAVAEKIREKLELELSDMVFDAVGDTMLEFLGAPANEESAETYMDTMIELSARIAVVAL